MMWKVFHVPAENGWCRVRHTELYDKQKQNKKNNPQTKQELIRLEDGVCRNASRYTDKT